MEKLYKTLFVLINACLLFNNANAQDQWVKITQNNNTFLNGTYAANADVVNKKVYIAFGLGNSTNIIEYSDDSKIWSGKTNFPSSARYGVASFTLGDSIYYVTGSTGSSVYLNETWAFGTSGNNWLHKSNFSGMNRIHATGFTVANKGYVFGGGTGSDNLRDLWEYDGHTWTQKASLTDANAGRLGAAAFVINGKAYIVGGRSVSNSYFNDLWEYDPTLNKWTQKASLPANAGTVNGVAYSIGGKGYYGLGINNNTYSKAFYEYDPIANVWTSITSFGGTGRYTSIAFVLNETAFVGLGSSDYQKPTYEKDIWKFDKTTDVSDPLEIKNTSLALSPNPSSDVITISFEKAITNATVVITTLSGQEVHKASDISGKISNISIAHLENGFYILTIDENGKTISKSKIIKN